MKADDRLSMYLLWQDLGPGDPAVALLRRAAAQAPGRREVLRALSAALALAGDPATARELVWRAAAAERGGWALREQADKP